MRSSAAFSRQMTDTSNTWAAKGTIRCGRSDPTPNAVTGERRRASNGFVSVRIPTSANMLNHHHLYPSPAPPSHPHRSLSPHPTPTPPPHPHPEPESHPHRQPHQHRHPHPHRGLKPTRAHTQPRSQPTKKHQGHPFDCPSWPSAAVPSEPSSCVRTLVRY